MYVVENRKISELTEVTTLNDDDELVFVKYEGGNLGPEPTPTPTPTPSPIPTPVVHSEIRTTAGTYFSSVLAGSRLYVSGQSDMGLGLGNVTWAKELTEVSDSVKLSETCNDTTIFVKNNGDIYGFGGHNDNYILGSYAGKRTPHYLGNIPNVVKIAIGDFHYLILTEDGKVYGAGNNQNSQANGDGSGSGNQGGTLTPISNPSLVTSLSSFDIKDIACGTRHSLVLTNNGDVYGFGLGDYFTFGGQTQTDHFSPVKLNLSNINKIYASSRTSMCIDNNNIVHLTGRITLAGGFSLVQNWTEVGSASFKETGVSQLSVSEDNRHTLYLMTNGTVFATGYNNFGQLGTGTTSTDIVPYETPVESTEFNKLSSSLLDFSTGRNHTILVTNAGEVYGFGDNQYHQLGMSIDQTAITSLTEIISY